MLALRIALRYLFARKSHNAVNIISIVSMLGVAVATAAIVCVLSVFNGFSDLATGRLSRIDPPLEIRPSAGKTIGNADSVAAALKRLPEISEALPVISEKALAMYAGSQMAVTLTGIPEGYDRVINLSQLIIDGDFYSSDPASAAATLSVGTAVRLQARPELPYLLKIFVPRRTGRINPANPMAAFRVDSLAVGGVYQVDDNESDAQTVVAPISIVAPLLEYQPGEATALYCAVSPGYSQADARRAAARALGSQYAVSDQLMQQSDSLHMIAVEKWVSFLMLAFILLIALFNVISTLSMLIIEKRDNMATLRALGATPGMTRSIFLWEGWLISAVGGAAGIVLGLGLSFAQQYGGFIKLGGDTSQLTISTYPVRVEALDTLCVAALIALLGWLIGWLTSRLAISGSGAR